MTFSPSSKMLTPLMAVSLMVVTAAAIPPLPAVSWTQAVFLTYLLLTLPLTVERKPSQLLMLLCNQVFLPSLAVSVWINLFSQFSYHVVTSVLVRTVQLLLCSQRKIAPYVEAKSMVYKESIFEYY